MDSDDCLSRDCILSLYHMACKNDADIVIGSFSYCDVEGKSIAKNILKDICYQGNDVFGKFFLQKVFMFKRGISYIDFRCSEHGRLNVYHQMLMRMSFYFPII